MSQLVGLHVDGVSVLLAQRFVFLGVERLALQVQMANLRLQHSVSRTLRPAAPPAGRAELDLWIPAAACCYWVNWTNWFCSYRADEAGVVPGVAQSLDELITSLHGEVAAVTLGAEECDVICERGSTEA